MVYKVLKPISSFCSLKENFYSTSAFWHCSYVYSDPFSDCKDILSDSQDCGVLYIPGVMTPTEVGAFFFFKWSILFNVIQLANDLA